VAAKISRVFKLKKVAGGNCKVAGALSRCDKGGPVIPCQLILLKPSVVAFKVLQNGIVCMSRALITHDPTSCKKMLQT